MWEMLNHIPSLFKWIMNHSFTPLQESLPTPKKNIGQDVSLLLLLKWTFFFFCQKEKIRSLCATLVDFKGSLLKYVVQKKSDLRQK